MEPTRKQSGVIPYRRTERGTEVLLITSTQTGQWQFPKGMLEPGLSPQESAENEALEEAGALGIALSEEVARYVYRKGWGLRCEVVLYPMPVQRTLPDTAWQEARDRQRRWATLDEAEALIHSPAVRACLAAFRRWIAVSSP